MVYEEQQWNLQLLRGCLARFSSIGLSVRGFLAGLQMPVVVLKVADTSLPIEPPRRQMINRTLTVLPHRSRRCGGVERVAYSERMEYLASHEISTSCTLAHFRSSIGRSGVSAEKWSAQARLANQQLWLFAPAFAE
jgi:hypothetical protein